MRRLAPTEEIRKKITASIPLRRFAQKCEIADLALFLSSDAASYITGAVFTCDGGTGLVGGRSMLPF
jgi:NAD(P)-dependent dehydrogenase (short-subunit alcohol dehydrogenase family)